MLFRHLYPVAFLMGLLCAFSTGSIAEEPQTPEAASPVSGLEERIQETRAQLDQVDAQMAALKDEEKALMTQARETQREQYEAWQQFVKEDEELQTMVQQAEAMQRDLHTLQEALAARMTDNPDYAANQSKQGLAMKRSGTIQKEVMDLANDRVRIQLELQALERQQAETASDATPEPEAVSTAPLAEDPDQL